MLNIMAVIVELTMIRGIITLIGYQRIIKIWHENIF